MHSMLLQDADVIVFRNPLRRIPVYADMSCSSDDFKPTRKPLDNPLNTGLYYVKSTSRSIEMVKHWRAARRRFPGRHDQQVFVAIKWELIRELNVTIEPLETVYFGARRRSAPCTPTAASGWAPRCTTSSLASPRIGRTTPAWHRRRGRRRVSDGPSLSGAGRRLIGVNHETFLLVFIFTSIVGIGNTAAVVR
jgi:hypothetical protein